MVEICKNMQKLICRLQKKLYFCGQFSKSPATGITL